MQGGVSPSNVSEPTARALWRFPYPPYGRIRSCKGLLDLSTKSSCQQPPCWRLQHLYTNKQKRKRLLRARLRARFAATQSKSCKIIAHTILLCHFFLLQKEKNSPRVEVQPPCCSNCARTPWQRLAYSGAAWASWAARWTHAAGGAAAEPPGPRATQTLAHGGWWRQGSSCGQAVVPSGATGAGRGRDTRKRRQRVKWLVPIYIP